jgi:hypothetical protein
MNQFCAFYALQHIFGANGEAAGQAGFSRHWVLLNPDEDPMRVSPLRFDLSTGFARYPP